MGDDGPEECRDVAEELDSLIVLERGDCPSEVELLPSISDGGLLWLLDEPDGGAGLCSEMGGFCDVITVNPVELFDVRG